MKHLSEEQFNDLADGSLLLDSEPELGRHLAECLPCRAEITRLNALLSRAKALPTTIEPPPEVWPLVAERILQPATPRDWNSATYIRRWPAWGWLAAAALLLVSISSLVTSLVVGRRQAPSAVTAVSGQADSGDAALVALSRREEGFRDAADELWATVNAGRDQLSPETIATVERSVVLIDVAIREAREALANDPNNPVISDMLSGSYQRKVDLLKRATELLPRS